jgi:hypothetical protein
MEISSLLFALGLFMAGIWLIFTISGDLKEKQRRAQRIPDVHRRRPHAARHVSSGARGPAESAARQSTPVPEADAAAAASQTGGERTEPVDESQGLDAAVVRERFEKFTHETKRTG